MRHYLPLPTPLFQEQGSHAGSGLGRTRTPASLAPPPSAHTQTQEQGPDSRFDFAEPDTLVPWTPAPASTSAGGREVGGEGCDGSGRLQRYCHLYGEGELEELCRGVGGSEVGPEWWDQGNRAVLLTKT
jgi:hypothetical protein